MSRLRTFLYLQLARATLRADFCIYYLNPGDLSFIFSEGGKAVIGLLTRVVSVFTRYRHTRTLRTVLRCVYHDYHACVIE